MALSVGSGEGEGGGGGKKGGDSGFQTFDKDKELTQVGQKHIVSYCGNTHASGRSGVDVKEKKTTKTFVQNLLIS